MLCKLIFLLLAAKKGTFDSPLLLLKGVGGGGGGVLIYAFAVSHHGTRTKRKEYMGTPDSKNGLDMRPGLSSTLSV